MRLEQAVAQILEHLLPALTAVLVIGHCATVAECNGESVAAVEMDDDARRESFMRGGDPARREATGLLHLCRGDAPIAPVAGHLQGHPPEGNRQVDDCRDSEYPRNRYAILPVDGIGQQPEQKRQQPPFPRPPVFAKATTGRPV
jgi:hypothetical protein